MHKTKISHITAREILDSRGNPTIETTVWAGKLSATASVPSGASTGTHEALELRDSDAKRFLGLGVTKACRNVEKKIAPALKGVPVDEQIAIDEIMLDLDATPTKKHLGANAILSVSLACARLAAHVNNKPLYAYLAKTFGAPKPKKLPTPLLNVINGGKHADSGLDIQEFFLIPLKGTLLQRLDKSRQVIANLKQTLQRQHFAVGVGDEGGFAPHLGSNEKALRILHQTILQSGFAIGKDFNLGLDAAASEFFDTDSEVYHVRASKKTYKPGSMYKLYQKWQRDYGVTIVEDGCAEDDYWGWQALSKHLGQTTTLVGDDVFVTNPERIQLGVISGIANAVLIKPNQIGSVTETVEAIQLAQKYNYQIVVSHRSGETDDTFIADLAVAFGADYIKAGSLARGERIAKYNRLLAIEQELR